MAYTYEEQDNGELLVIDNSKGVIQTIPNLPRPYNVVYIPETNNVVGVTNLNDLNDVEFHHLKVVK